ncbi:MAG: J domain-containing protein, partial [Planctomycetota bacterium]
DRPRVAETREQALAVLDLPADATPEQIRKRHRELVRKFHPDAQPSLGPIAQREATERFTAIQRAYETLSA